MPIDTFTACDIVEAMDKDACTVFSRSLRLECIRQNGNRGTIDKVLTQIATLAKRSQILKSVSVDDIYNALEARERIGSTGFIREAAIPHCSFEGISDFVVGVLTVPDGTDFNARDGVPTKVFFFIIGPRVMRDDHIMLLSTITKLMRNPDAVGRIVDAPDELSLFRTVHAIAPSVHYAESPSEERCIVHVFIRRQKILRDILQVFTETPNTSLSVVESGNTSRYLMMTPMYASLKHAPDDGYLKTVVAVVSKPYLNEIIRRINLITDGPEYESGVLLTVQDLIYSHGTLKF